LYASSPSWGACPFLSFFLIFTSVPPADKPFPSHMRGSRSIVFFPVHTTRPFFFLHRPKSVRNFPPASSWEAGGALSPCTKAPISLSEFGTESPPFYFDKPLSITLPLIFFVMWDDTFIHPAPYGSQEVVPPFFPVFHSPSVRTKLSYSPFFFCSDCSSPWQVNT